MSYPPSDLDTDCRMEEEGHWWLQRAPNKVRAEEEAWVSLRAEVVKLCSTELFKGAHGPCQLPLPFNSISYHHDQGQFTVLTLC